MKYFFIWLALTAIVGGVALGEFLWVKFLKPKPYISEIKTPQFPNWTENFTPPQHPYDPWKKDKP